MSTYRVVSKAFLRGLTGSFSVAPTGRLERLIVKTPVQTRVYLNFARAGARINSAMTQVSNEQKKPGTEKNDQAAAAA